MNPNFQVQINYGAFNFLETGGYFGITVDDFGFDNFLSYGLNANFHVLPLFIKNKDSRFDLYATGKLGFDQVPGIQISENRKEPKYAFGGGLAFYLTKHWGFFTEYTYGNFSFTQKTNLRYGLSLKFPKKKSD